MTDVSARIHEIAAIDLDDGLICDIGSIRARQCERELNIKDFGWVLRAISADTA